MDKIFSLKGFFPHISCPQESKHAILYNSFQWWLMHTFCKSKGFEMDKFEYGHKVDLKCRAASGKDHKPP